MAKDITLAQQLRIGDVIAVTDKWAIQDGGDLTNGGTYNVVGVHMDTADTVGHIVVTDDAGDDLEIVEAEFRAIKWVA